MSGRATVIQTKTKAEGSVFVNSFLSEITQSKGVGPTVARAALGSKTTDGVVDLDAEEEPPTSPTQSSIAVVGSGNLGLVWFTGNDHRLTVEELEELHPGLVAAVAAHPGVGLLLVRSKEPAPSSSDPRAPASSTRTASRARTRRPCSGRTRS